MLILLYLHDVSLVLCSQVMMVDIVETCVIHEEVVEQLGEVWQSP